MNRIFEQWFWNAKKKEKRLNSAESGGSNKKCCSAKKKQITAFEENGEFILKNVVNELWNNSKPHAVILHHLN